MKFSNIFLVLLIATILGLIIWNNAKENDKSLLIKTEKPFITTIEQKRVIPGNLYPLTEIDIKSPISGTLDKVFVEIGDKVNIGDKIAQIKLVPDASKLESAKSNLISTEINFENQQKNFARNKILFDKQIIAPTEFENHKKEYELSKEQYLSAKNQLMLIEEGFVKNTTISNVVRATAAGTIIDLPLKEGSSITERNNFNDGTTIAIVARLDTFVFKGNVNETDMIYLHQGMKLKLSFNAYKNQIREAIVNKISSKGISEQGVMKYYVEAKFDLKNDSLVIRSGYTANAEMILKRKKNVLAIKEKFLEFQNDSTYVTVINKENKEEKRLLTTGLSDGFNIEILKGLRKNEKFKTIED
ncbi:efflux RND transporter periplasmic adaptor subunit [Flavobacterium sp.]|uniref:efflux RND transporter periplasmic adaptor subunit n=1 Tax=Flavobacterium sp. TaxID=239 RepID=UPI002D0F1D3D|nr:efflux RND transporter periplasmic adaptor subunit [Flavobacterium sp.]HSD09295.1 efflux RND transporter periplasmic adaptor subunit [Flavobacterium sp.]